MDKAQTASHADDGRYALLVNSITDYAIYMLDVTGRVTSWNPGAQRFKGYEADEIIGQHFSRFYTESDRAAGVPARALATAVTEGRFEQEGWRVRKDGARFWAHVVIDPIRTSDGALAGFAKITRDLTERRAAEEALRRSEEQFRLLVEGVTDYAIYMLDPHGRVTSWNAGAQRIKGYAPSEILGEHFSRFYTDEDRAAALPEQALTLAAAEGRLEKEGWRVRKDGSRFRANVVIDAIRDSRGELIGFAKVTRDVTEREEAQRALEDAREALFQAQKMEAVGQLTGGVAHDFNNLLMAVLGSLELVRKRLPYDRRITPLIDNAIRGAQRGTVLTQRMLAFARKQELQLEAVDLPALVRGMADFMSRTIGPTIEVRLQLPRKLPAVRTDPYQLEAALLNLVVNARDAMPAGGVVTIGGEAVRNVQAHPRLRPGDYVRLSVADTGEGMDEETLARAADPFFTTKGVGKGTGLGLSMVHGLAAQSGGDLEMSSRPGEGTEVALWLPLASGADVTTADAADQTEPPLNGRRLRVLAVDDDSLVLTNTAAMLDDLGHDVVLASSAQEALEAMDRETDIDLVITDEMMPHMTGSQLAEVIATRRPGLPVALASGFADLEAGVTLPRLAKPFTQAELAEFVEEAVSAGPARRPMFA